MTISLKHLFESQVADGADDNLVQPSDWNDEHVLLLATNKLIGRATAGTGAAEEIDCTAFARSILDDASEAVFKATVNLEIGVDVQAWSAVLDATTASFLTAHETKLGHISVTQAVDLDAIETRVNALDAAVVLKGTWNAGSGSFPGGGTAQAGDSYIVSNAGTVNGVAFVENDRILAITDNASTSTYANNWHKLDYTDQVLSVAGRTGAVTLAVADLSDASANGRSLISAANYAAMRALLDLEAGTDFYSIAGANAAFQAADAELAAIAGLTSAANKLAYFTGSGSAALADLTSFGRSLIDDADAAAGRTTLSVRETITGARTYYVRTDGSDSNTGLANNSGGAFLTIQKAIDTVATLDLGTHDVTIQIAAGTYQAATGNQLKNLIGSGKVIIVGDESTPSNVIVECTGVMSVSTGVFWGSNVAGIYSLRGMRQQMNASATGFRVGINATNGTVVEFQKIDFGSIANAHLFADMGGVIQATGDWSISGSSARHLYGTGGFFRINGVSGSNRTVTLTGTPAFSTAFAVQERGGYMGAAFMTFSGSATGPRYNVNYSGTINTGGGGANYFPGDSAGTDNSGAGHYV